MKKFLIAVVCLGAVQELRPQSIQTAADLMTCQPGWDIYKAGTYRYGPSFIINDDGSIDAWFAASGDSYGDMYYKSSTTQSALQIKTVKSVGQCFEAKDDFHRVSICCPTWSRPTGERVIISVYQWRVS